jgi:hypothetical protein
MLLSNIYCKSEGFDIGKFGLMVDVPMVFVIKGVNS